MPIGRAFDAPGVAGYPSLPKRRMARKDDGNTVGLIEAENVFEGVREGVIEVVAVWLGVMDLEGVWLGVMELLLVSVAVTVRLPVDVVVALTEVVKLGVVEGV